MSEEKKEDQTPKSTGGGAVLGIIALAIAGYIIYSVVQLAL